MKMQVYRLSQINRWRPRAISAFTLIEVMVSTSIALIVTAAAMGFTYFSGIYLSGITAQTGLDQKAGNAIEFIQTRARLANSVSVTNSGNTLILGFDDDPLVDSDGDGIPYNDNDHFEQFSFLGVNGTNTSTVSANSLVYISNTASNTQQVIIPAGLRNLPGYNIFSVINSSMVIIRFGLTDGYTRDHYQSVDIQATAVPLNRTAAVNFISILPL